MLLSSKRNPSKNCCREQEKEEWNTTCIMPDSFWDESSSDESAPPDESDREESEYRAREHQLFDTEMCSPHLHPLDPKRLILPLRINAHELERRRHIPAIHEDPPYPYVTGHAIFRGGGVPETLCYDRDAFPNMVDFLFPCEHKTHHPVLLPPTLEAAEFLKVMRFSLPCYSCNLCPTFVSEHHHAFGEVCNTRCVICRLSNTCDYSPIITITMKN